MASMSDFAGQSLTWVRHHKYWDLTASDNSFIARFPVELKGAYGYAGKRSKKATAIVPDGTGKLFLNEEGQQYDRHLAIYADEEGPCLATYRYDSGWLAFSDGRRLQWNRRNFWGALWHLWHFGEMHYWSGGWVEPGLGAYVEILEGRSKRVIISPRADEIGDPELSILVVLGLYNMVVENIQGFFESIPRGPLPFGGG